MPNFQYHRRSHALAVDTLSEPETENSQAAREPGNHTLDAPSDMVLQIISSLRLDKAPEKPFPLLSFPRELCHAIYAYMFPSPSIPNISDAVAIRLTMPSVASYILS
jgi:hypothetical protein